MKDMREFLVFCLIISLCICTAPVAAVLPGGGVSVIFQCTDAISSAACNANDAVVYVDGVNTGTVQNGIFEIPYEDGFSTYKITKSGYNDKQGIIDAPAPGQTSDIVIDATLIPAPVGNSKGWFTVHSNVDGASVAFNSVTKGTINNGVFSFEVSTTGMPYTTYSVSKSGYVTYEGYISNMPTSDQTIDLFATLNPVPTATTTQSTTISTTVPAPIGGDAGWYTIHCNVDGASVYFDNSYKGVITGGVLSVQVITTGTPYSSYRVEKSGYVSQSGSLPTTPAKGQTKDVYVTLSPLSTPVPIPAGAGKGYFTVHSNVEGADVFFDGSYQGTINSGILTVPVATTGTPIRSYEVKKTGYRTYTGSITQYPSVDQTIDIYATLSVVTVKTTIATTIPTPLPTTQSPLPLPVIIGAVLATICMWGTSKSRKNS
jgi:hypothetical protein